MRRSNQVCVNNSTGNADSFPPEHDGQPSFILTSSWVKTSRMTWLKQLLCHRFVNVSDATCLLCMVFFVVSCLEMMLCALRCSMAGTINGKQKRCVFVWLMCTTHKSELYMKQSGTVGSVGIYVHMGFFQVLGFPNTITKHTRWTSGHISVCIMPCEGLVSHLGRVPTL